MGSRATLEAFPESLLAMSRTAMPFLYHTKTIAGAPCMRATRKFHTINRRAISQTYYRRYPIIEKGSSPSSPVPRDAETDTLDPEIISGDSDVKFTVEKTGASHEPLSTRAWKSLEPDTNSTPNGQQVEGSGLVIRKILQADFPTSARPPHLGGVATSASTSRLPKLQERKTTTRSSDNQRDDDFDEFEKANDIKFVGPEPSNASGLGEDIVLEKDAIDELAIKSSRHQDRESTITHSERLAFQKIFADIFTRQRGSPQGDTAPRDPFEDGWEEGKAHDKSQRAKTQLSNIMSQALSEQPTRDQMEQIVNRYPAPLRAAASRAIGLDIAAPQLEGEEEVILDETADNPRLEELQNAERDRVETLMRNAKTDFALWSIMEAEVFPLISKLGLGEVQKDKPDEGRTKKRGRKSKKNTQSNEGQPTTNSFGHVEDGISPLELYGPLYPSYLLLGLRLLDRSFAKPSPLTLSVLPKIKSLGLISQVLGASTQLYNELMIILWYRRDDFRGVVDLLKEMEQSGLDWDEETLSIVEDIARMQRMALNGSRGPAMKLLWSFPEFAPGVFGTWSRKIRQALQERNAEGVQLLPY